MPAGMDEMKGWLSAPFMNSVAASILHNNNYAMER